MPDPDFKTISSSQTAALFNQSSWSTHKMLWASFRLRQSDDRPQNLRMKLGKMFESIIVDRVAEQMALDVVPNPDQKYVRHPEHRIGCTRDAEILCPTRGRGIVEAKSIDKYEFKEHWTATAAPVEYEIQLQHQMLVEGATWGIIACLVYNDGADGVLTIYERRPNDKLQARIIAETAKFFADLDAGIEPPAFGMAAELECLNDLYPETDPTDVLEDIENAAAADLAQLYKWAVDQRASAEKAVKDLKPKIIDMMKAHGRANLPGTRIFLDKSPVAGQVVLLPWPIRKALRAVLPTVPEEARQAITEAVEWHQVLRRPTVQNRLTVRLDGENSTAEGD